LRTAGIILIVLVLAVVIAFKLTGHSLGVYTLVCQPLRHGISLVRAIIDAPSVTDSSRGEYTNIIFLHHSTGHNLIAEGGVRQQFQEAGYDFWDHDYNEYGLKRPNGSPTGYSYRIPDDNTNPDGLARIFTQRTYSLPLNALSGLLQHEVIVFKSCFSVSHIVDDEQLEEYKSYYLTIRETMDAHPEKIFIVMTPPPLNPSATDSNAAGRARVFANWLKSDEYLGAHPNVFTFDFFDHLAESDSDRPDYNMLRDSYREGSDSHPNQMANERIGSLFVEFIIDAIRSRGNS